MNLRRAMLRPVLPLWLGLAGAVALFGQSPQPDLTLTINHTGNFIQGQTGATYSIVVTNVGTAATFNFSEGSTPTVSVTPSIPGGLIGTGLQGQGWSCAVPPIGPCTRFDDLQPGESFPPIILTVDVATDAPPTVITRASLTAPTFADTNPNNNTAQDPTTIFIAATPIITSIGSSFAADTTPVNPAAITSGTPVNSFKLYIQGTNIDPRETTTVTWFNPATGQTVIFSGPSVTVTAGLITVVVPGALIATPVTTPVNVQITVTQQIPGSGSAAPAAIGRRPQRLDPRVSPQAGTSNTGIFTINPPLSTLGPTLPAATLNSSYSQKYFTGGTPAYQFRLNSGALPPGLSVSPDGTTIAGIPTSLGTFTFNLTTIDIWNNRLTADYTIQVSGTGPTITSVVPNSAPAGISSVQITVNGANFTPTPTSTTAGVPGSVVTWTVAGSAPVALTTTFVSSTQLTAVVPGSLLQSPVIATINVSQSGGVTTPSPVVSNGVPFTVNAPSISVLVPPGATAGGPGFTLTVNGANFVNNTQPAASSQVSFGGTQLPTTFVNSGSLTVSITAAMIANPGPISVVVTNPGGSRSNTVTFNVFPGPTLLSINPNSAKAGGPAFTLTATGTNFTVGMSIRWNGTALPSTCVGAAASAPAGSACASNQLSATVAASLIATPGTAQVSVGTSDGVVTSSLPFTILAGLQITTTALPDATLNTPYSFTLTATGGTGNLTWSATGLPAGLQLNASTGTISGTPTAAGTFTVSVSVSDQGNQTATKQFTLNVGNKLVITTTALPNGKVGTNYSFTLTASGGTPPLTWSATGLPSGLQVNPASGAITGTPTAPGTFAVNVSVSDSAEQSATARFLLLILNPLVITTTALPNGTVNLPYTAIVNATGGVAPDTWSATGLPPGLSITTTPSACAPFPSGFVPFSSVAYVSQANSAGDLLLVGSMTTADFARLQNIPLPAQPNQQFCGTVQLANGFSAVAYVPTPAERAGDFSPFIGLLLDPQNNNQPISGGIIPGSRIPGLFAWRIAPAASNPGSATISGIPTLAGTFNVTLTVNDSSGLTATATLPLIILSGLSLQPATLPNGFTGTAYSFTFTAVGGVAPLSWSAAGVPPGLSINPSTGTLSGVPTAAGTFTINVTVRDSTGQSATLAYSLTIISRLTITSGPLPPATANVPYSFRLTATGGVPPYVWSATGLAPGLVLNPQTGDITGTPTAASSGVVTVMVTDQSGQTATAQFPFSVAPPNPPPSTLQIVTNSLPAGTAGVAYGTALAASGGTPDYTFSIAGGALPAGLTLSGIGFIGGTPTTPGQSQVTIRVTDSAGGTATKSFTIQINPAPLTVTGAVNDLTVGSDFSFQFGATGGVPPYVFSAGGAIPGGRFTPDGTLSGTATTVGTFTFSVSVTDSTGTSASKSFTVKVTALPLTITTTSIGSGTVGVPISVPISATGGVPPYTFAASGAPGLSFSGNVLRGTPTEAGTFTVGVTVTDSAGAQASKSFTLVVSGTLQITTTTLGDGVVGSPYSASLAASGGVPPYSFAVSGLPDGISAASNGALSGTPTTRGTFQVSATVTDANGTKASKSFSVTITAPPLTITTATLPNATAGTAYSAAITATGGVPPYSFVGTGLPGGISLGANGSLSGTPTGAGTTTVAVTVTDSAGTTAQAGLSLTVVLPTPPNVTVTGVPSTTTSASQTNVQVSLDRAFPVAVTVTLTLTITPVAGTPPQDAQFANGTQTFSFVVPANTPPTPTNVPLQVGTVAGTITITERLSTGTQDITPSPAPTQTITIAPSVPVFTGSPSVTATRSSTGFTVVATGFSNTREISQAIFTFTAAAGTTLQTSTVTIPGDTLFAPYYAGAGSNATGGSFRLTQPFTINGNQTGVVSVTLTLVNRIGSSQAVTANLQ